VVATAYRVGRSGLARVWTNKTITPFERPNSFAGRAYMTAEEAATSKPH